MREDALIAALRRYAQLPDSDLDYTDEVLRLEMNDVLQAVFAPALFAARSGYLLKRFTFPTTAGTDVYPLPSRAMNGAVENVVCLDLSTNEQWGLEPIEANDAFKYVQTSQDKPRFFQAIGSSIRLFPTPNAAYTLRMQYYLRPPRLMQFQTTGAITDISSGVYTVASWPTNRDTGATVAAATSFDIVRGGIATPTAATPNGANTYEVVAANVFPDTFSSGGLTMTFETSLASASYADVSEVRVGDFVRVADQTDWPTMPHEFHSALAHAAASRILAETGRLQMAQAQASIAQADIDRMKDVIQPRVKGTPPVLVPQAHMLRRGFWGGMR